MNETPPIHHVPRARHAFDVKMHDGAIIHVRQHGLAGAPRLVLSHGNGLAIDGYFPFGDRFAIGTKSSSSTFAIMGITRCILPRVIPGQIYRRHGCGLARDKS